MFTKLFRKLFPSQNSNIMETLVKDAFLVDVRSAEEFSGGHIKGSVNIPLQQIESRFSEFENKKAIVVFCASGMRSRQAKAILENRGFQNVTNGGSWQSVNQIINR